VGRGCGSFARLKTKIEGVSSPEGLWRDAPAGPWCCASLGWLFLGWEEIVGTYHWV